MIIDRQKWTAQNSIIMDGEFNQHRQGIRNFARKRSKSKGRTAILGRMAREIIIFKRSTFVPLTVQETLLPALCSQVIKL